MIISLIAAMSKNRVIGCNGAIPWDLAADRTRFKQLTMGHTLIMGRRTFESIGKPLPGRTTVVITRQTDFTACGCLVAHSLPDALTRVGNDSEVFICGGEDVYRQGIAMAQRIYLTIVNLEVEGDTWFPEIPADVFREVISESLPGSIPCLFTVWERV